MPRRTHIDRSQQPKRAKKERKSGMTRKALDAIFAGSIPKGYRGPFSLKTGKPITLKPSE